jgi:hypothetical protein
MFLNIRHSSSYFVHFVHFCYNRVCTPLHLIYCGVKPLFYYDMNKVQYPIIVIKPLTDL